MYAKERFFFYEDNPHYGFRRAGNGDGYETVNELLEDMREAIKHNKEQKYPSYIYRATMLAQLT